MGMFDSLYDEDGTEWQTKAFERILAQYNIGDVINSDFPVTYQVEVFGGKGDGFNHSHATIFYGVLVEVDVPRDTRLPLIDIGGALTENAKED